MVSGHAARRMASSIATSRSGAMAARSPIMRAVRDAAARNGTLYVLPANADFHSMCAPANERWTDPTGKETNSFPAHPTPAGQKAMAEAIADVLKKL